MKSALEKQIKTSIKDISLFETAFTHRSAVNENKELTMHNERMEFLGDAVLELVVTDYLYHKYPQLQEGILTNLRSSLVKGETLAEVAKDLDFGSFLRVSRGEALFGGREKTSLLANTVEAIIGAIYLDSGFDAARHFIHSFLIPKLQGIIAKKEYIDAKSQFQQIAQAEFKATPYYKELSSSGPDHNKSFEVGVFVNEEQYGVGSGSSKQSAQQSAAQDALMNMGVNIDILNNA